MRVRCGACRNQFEVPGPGRFACPVCGSVNVVREANTQGPSTIGGYQATPGAATSGVAQPPPPPSQDAPMPRVECPECGFSFVVGKIAVATCPNCSAEVATGQEEESESA